MKPTEKSPERFVWRFSEIGIEILYDRKARFWGGRLCAGGRCTNLPHATIDLIVTSHRLESQVQ